MKFYFSLISLLLMGHTYGQSSINGVLYENDTTVVANAYVALFTKSDSNMVKIESTKIDGSFKLSNLKPDTYFIKATFVGFADLIIDRIELSENESKTLGKIQFASNNLDVVEITAERAILEVKPDRTIFNVEGTINSTGANAIELLRKAPAVTVDNNDNISVLGRSGVRVYIDGKQLPLAGDDLSGYLKNLPADQIDRIEIITTPGAKYEAEGNAGIIDIRLKKDMSMGSNGSLNATATQGELFRGSLSGNGNYRNKKVNVFGSAGVNRGDNFHNIMFRSKQNGLYLDEINNTGNNSDALSYRLGTDFFINKQNTIGFLYSGNTRIGEEVSYNKIAISKLTDINAIDSILIAENSGDSRAIQNTVNLNYRFYSKKGKSLDVDLDYGNYDITNKRNQPNLYYNNAEDTILSELINSFNTPINISIYTGKIDYETNFVEGKLGFGSKVSRVETKNTFEAFDVVNDTESINNLRSNKFNYNESVYALYVSYAKSLGKKWKFVSGLRAEQTIADGDLQAYSSTLAEEPVELNYLKWFPNAGITWDIKPKNTMSLNYGRRINRPDYNVLNPFRNQLSELSIEKGNPYLKPEIVNNLELGYTLLYMYNFKLGYSVTTDKITRLIGPDDTKPQAGFISWDNLATQSVWSFNASLPFKFNKWWSAYFNAGLSYIDNQADYGVNGSVDVQLFSYMIYGQNTFSLFKGIKADISGYYSGPGVWGGTFLYDSNWSLSAGVQKVFFKKKLKVSLKVNNIFNRIGWQGESEFNNLVSTGNGRFDNRYVSLNLNYSFGNQKLKTSKRKTGLETEGGRVK
jgi:iron complex outermembrane receptor protein